MFGVMTDEDRYARCLGKKFKAVRARLCAPDPQPNAAAFAAHYIVSLLDKELGDLPALYQRVEAVLGQQPQLFGIQPAINSLARASNGSLAEQHFVEAVQCVVSLGGDSLDVLRKVTSNAIQSTRECLALQRGFSKDLECHAAFDAHREQIERHLLELIKQKCGIGGMELISKPAREDQESLLEFVVVREQR